MKLLPVFLVALFLLRPATAQASALDRYDIGTPDLTELWIDPRNGDDANSGASRDAALRSVGAAWQRIPLGQPLTTGYHLLLTEGVYDAANFPHFWESRYGSYAYPILVQAADGPGTALLTAHVNVYDSRYLYFIDLDIQSGADGFHCERCDHVLLRGLTITGAEPDSYDAQETVKFNQSQYIYLEDNDISGAWDNAVDYVAVQYGHVRGNRIHNAGDWCMYAKGGSATLEIEANEFFDCGTGGFSAGQGTGFQFMTPPWLQYEAYDIRFVNNVVHDTRGAAVGVQGGHNILIAFNTFVRVGANSHTLEFVFGSRSCDGQPGDEGRERCATYAAQGGWGDSAIADGENYVRIPNRNVYVYNNLLYNPEGSGSQYQHLTVFAPWDTPAQRDAGVPAPTRADDNLQIRGNLIWNGGPEHPLGVEYDAGCAPENPTCNAEQLRADNAINTAEPLLANVDDGDFRLTNSTFAALPIPPFPDDSLPAIPSPPLETVVTTDINGQPREAGGAVGAYAG